MKLLIFKCRANTGRAKQNPDVGLRCAVSVESFLLITAELLSFTHLLRIRAGSRWDIGKHGIVNPLEFGFATSGRKPKTTMV